MYKMWRIKKRLMKYQTGYKTTTNKHTDKERERERAPAAYSQHVTSTVAEEG